MNQFLNQYKYTSPMNPCSPLYGKDSLQQEDKGETSLPIPNPVKQPMQEQVVLVLGNTNVQKNATSYEVVEHRRIIVTDPKVWNSTNLTLHGEPWVVQTFMPTFKDTSTKDYLVGGGLMILFVTLLFLVSRLRF